MTLSRVGISEMQECEYANYSRSRSVRTADNTAQNRVGSLGTEVRKQFEKMVSLATKHTSKHLPTQKRCDLPPDLVVGLHPRMTMIEEKILLSSLTEHREQV